jgi:hypothetical protein
VKIRHGFLYGREFTNRKILEQRKRKHGVDVIEQELRDTSRHAASAEGFLGFMNAMYSTVSASQNGERRPSRNEQLRGFYSSRFVMRLSWDTARSLRSSLDTAAEKIERLAGDAIQKTCETKRKKVHIIPRLFLSPVLALYYSRFISLYHMSFSVARVCGCSCQALSSRILATKEADYIRIWDCNQWFRNQSERMASRAPAGSGANHDLPE